MKRVILQPAYVLHRRSYRETSFLVDIFTPDYGRLSVIAKGVKKARTAHQGILQPFVPLSISWAGRHELVSLVDVEQNGEILPLRGECLFAGFYVNELLMYLLQKWDAHPFLYQQYAKTLDRLANVQLQEQHLRVFEKCLLEEIGYGFFPKSITSITYAFQPHLFYRFIPEQGFLISDVQEVTPHSNIFSGKNLLAIAKEDWHNDTILKDAKRLIRHALAPLLGTKVIHSRQLFSQAGEDKYAK